MSSRQVPVTLSFRIAADLFLGSLLPWAERKVEISADVWDFLSPPPPLLVASSEGASSSVVGSLILYALDCCLSHRRFFRRDSDSSDASMFLRVVRGERAIAGGGACVCAVALSSFSVGFNALCRLDVGGFFGAAARSFSFCRCFCCCC